MFAFPLFFLQWQIWCILNFICISKIFCWKLLKDSMAFAARLAPGQVVKLHVQRLLLFGVSTSVADVLCNLCLELCVISQILTLSNCFFPSKFLSPQKQSVILPPAKLVFIDIVSTDFPRCTRCKSCPLCPLFTSTYGTMAFWVTPGSPVLWFVFL